MTTRNSSSNRAAKDKALVKQLRKRCDKARNFPANTDPSSRHVQMMADGLTTKRGYPMLAEEPDHCAISLYATVANLWEARTEVERWRKMHAKWCVAMMRLGIPAFGTLDEAFKKLERKLKQSR